MKKIHIGLLRNENNDYNKEYIIHILKQSNSLITIPHTEYEGDKLNKIISEGAPIYAYFKSKYKDYSERIMICFQEFDIDSFFNIIKIIVEISLKDLKELSKKILLCESELIKDKIIGSIKNVILKSEYKKPLNLIYLISDIFKTVVTSHFLIDGNKRFSAILLANLLYQQGIFLKVLLNINIKIFMNLTKKKLKILLKNMRNFLPQIFLTKMMSVY